MTIPSDKEQKIREIIKKVQHDGYCDAMSNLGEYAIGETMSIDEAVIALLRLQEEEVAKAEASIKELVVAIKSARGSLGYGSLVTMESTIRGVREILDAEILKHTQTKEGKA